MMFHVTYALTPLTSTDTTSAVVAPAAALPKLLSVINMLVNKYLHESVLKISSSQQMRLLVIVI